MSAVCHRLLPPDQTRDRSEIKRGHGLLLHLRLLLLRLLPYPQLDLLIITAA